VTLTVLLEGRARLYIKLTRNPPDLLGRHITPSLPQVATSTFRFRAVSSLISPTAQDSRVEQRFLCCQHFIGLGISHSPSHPTSEIPHLRCSFPFATKRPSLHTNASLLVPGSLSEYDLTASPEPTRPTTRILPGWPSNLSPSGWAVSFSSAWVRSSFAS
jgi:hypothetical protein